MKLRAFQKAMNAAGYTRQWKYKRDRREWRNQEAYERGLRWCISCGRDLHYNAKVSAMYCSASCREHARQKRRAPGVYPGYMAKGPVCQGLDLDSRELEHRRFNAFYLCHGQTIDQAPKVCKRWEWQASE